MHFTNKIDTILMLLLQNFNAFGSRGEAYLHIGKIDDAIDDFHTVSNFDYEQINIDLKLRFL